MKILAVQNFARSQTKQDVSSFLGLTGYYRNFVPNYAAIVIHLIEENSLIISTGLIRWKLNLRT